VSETDNPPQTETNPHPGDQVGPGGLGVEGGAGEPEDCALSHSSFFCGDKRGAKRERNRERI
jgi:hypothetical protein